MTAPKLLHRFYALDEVERRYVVGFMLGQVGMVAEGFTEVHADHDKALWALSHFAHALDAVPNKTFEEWMNLHWPKDVPKDCSNLRGGEWTYEEGAPALYDCLDRDVLAVHRCPSCAAYAQLSESHRLKEAAVQHPCGGDGLAAQITLRTSEPNSLNPTVQTPAPPA